jgi:hypothetical protein
MRNEELVPVCPLFGGLIGRRARHQNKPPQQHQPTATGQPAKSGQTGTNGNEQMNK